MITSLEQSGFTNDRIEWPPFILCNPERNATKVLASHKLLMTKSPYTVLHMLLKEGYAPILNNHMIQKVKSFEINYKFSRRRQLLRVSLHRRCSAIRFDHGFDVVFTCFV